MAQPYSNSQTSYGYGYGYGNAYGYNYGYQASSAVASSYDYRNQADFQSICDDILGGARNLFHHLRAYLSAKLRSQRGFSGLASRAAFQFRRNLTRQRLLSFPHLIVLFWVFVLLWGERWIFATKVRSCDWDHWEDWVRFMPNNASVSILIPSHLHSSYLHNIL